VIIGISGKKRSGKDTVYRLIRGNAGILAVRAAFGDQIKEEVAGVTGVDLDHIEEHKERFRPILQWWGSDFRRHYKGESYWLDKMLAKMKTITGREVLVITDVRFPNEVELVKKAGGIMIRVERKTGLEDAHSSENLLDSFEGFDYRLSNNGSLFDLREKVERIVTQHCCISPEFRAASDFAAVR
jgi:hypothetical protein